MLALRKFCWIFGHALAALIFLASLASLTLADARIQDLILSCGVSIGIVVLCWTVFKDRKNFFDTEEDDADGK